MDITKVVYTEIIKGVAKSVYETGGILGESKGIVSYVELDTGIDRHGMKKCYYSPNTQKLNKCISVWGEYDINFCEIFHSHLGEIVGYCQKAICVI